MHETNDAARTYELPKRPFRLPNARLVRLLRPLSRNELQWQKKENLCRMDRDTPREKDDQEHDAMQHLRPRLRRTLVDLERVQWCRRLRHDLQDARDG